jgi:predicted NBD/HSP70 family sugar kinase
MADATIGVDLGGTKALFVRGERASRVDTGPTFTPDDFVAQLALVACDREAPSRIGIAVPGLVDDRGRVVACDVLPALGGWSPRATLAALGYEHVAVVNDVRAALLEELHDAPSGLTAAVVMVGTAVGAAFVANGSPLLGTSGWAGELGYLPCAFGDEVKRLDDVAGGAAMAARRGVDARQFAELARAGDPSAIEAIRDGGAALGTAIAALVNLLNPSRIALGGGALELPGYRESLERAAERHSIAELWRDCHLARVRAGERVVAFGARRAAAVEAARDASAARR